MNDLITKIEQMQAEAREGMKRASRDSDPYLYQYLVGKFHAFGKVAGILKKLPMDADTAAFQKGVQEGRRLEREDVKSIIQSRIVEILGDAQPNPILRMELQELIKKIKA